MIESICWKKGYRMIIIAATAVCSLSLVQCTVTACDQAQHLRWKAMQASTESEKQYYEEQAKFYDANCAKENDARYQQEKDRQLRGRGK